jgi:prepilin-type N-terminal cleavage/methylation domain-containing protein/prepilin-type processing-associated H-X9-DG protein
MRSDSQQAGRGFTLIELLVVTSIIALLVGILLPVLGNARESARMTFCLNNMRQMGIATVNYAYDHDGLLPDVGFSHGGSTYAEQGSWFFLLEQYNGGEAGKLAYRCPSDDSPAWDTPQGSPPRLRRVSYATNFLLTGRSGIAAYVGLNNLDLVPRPAATAYIVELSEPPGSPGFATADHVHPETWPAAPAFLDDQIRPQVEIEQHQGRANYTFLDGHAANYARADVFETAAAGVYLANKFFPDIAR